MNVSRETQARLEIFRRSFLRWNAKTNLSSDRDPETFFERHVIDSLQLLDHLGHVHEWVDVGSGGGFPGIVIAAADDRERHVTLVESNGKKAAFLRTVALEMDLDVRVLSERAEFTVAREPAPELVSARAVAPLDRLLDLLSPWLSAGTIGLFPKGRMAEDEIANAGKSWEFVVERYPSVTAPDATILAIRDLRPKRAAIVAS